MPAAIVTFDNLANFPPAVAAALCGQGRMTLTLPVNFNLADAAPLFVVPPGMRIAIERPLIEVIVPFTGGAASAIGLSSSNVGYNTKGDLAGGAAGDVAAGLTAGFKGTLGTKAATQGVIVLVGGDVIRFDRITSVFTAGSGFAHIPFSILPAS